MSTKNNIIACDKRRDMFLITLSSWFFYKSPLITSVKCFSCLTMVKIVSLIVLLFCYKMSAAVRSQTSGEAGSGFNRAGKQIQWRSLQLMFYSLQCLWRLRAKFKKQGFARKPALLRGTESRTKSQKIGKMFYRRLQIRSARFRK